MSARKYSADAAVATARTVHCPSPVPPAGRCRVMTPVSRCKNTVVSLAPAGTASHPRGSPSGRSAAAPEARAPGIQPGAAQAATRAKTMQGRMWGRRIRTWSAEPPPRACCRHSALASCSARSRPVIESVSLSFHHAHHARSASEAHRPTPLSAALSSLQAVPLLPFSDFGAISTLEMTPVLA